MTFRAYIEGESLTVTDSPRIARAAYEELLARDDLIGSDAVAVLERDGHVLYESRFGAKLREGRLHPETPLDVYASAAAARQLSVWRPTA